MPINQINNDFVRRIFSTFRNVSILRHPVYVPGFNEVYHYGKIFETNIANRGTLRSSSKYSYVRVQKNQDPRKRPTMNINARIIPENTRFRRICNSSKTQKDFLAPSRREDSMAWKIRTRNHARRIFHFREQSTNICLAERRNRASLPTAAAYNRRSALAIESGRRAKGRKSDVAESRSVSFRHPRWKRVKGTGGFLLAGFPAFTRDGTVASLLPNGQRNR